MITINCALWSFACFFKSLITLLQLKSSKLEVGSSANIKLGELIRARAILALCFSPSLSWFGFCWYLSLMFRLSKIFLASPLVLLWLKYWANFKFSLIVNEEIKCGFWKTIPILSPLNLSSSVSENFEISLPEILIDPDSGFKIPLVNEEV